MFEHEHPLNFIDLWSKELKHEEEDEESEEETEDLISNQDFRCLCFRCDEEINWFHRYYYTCGQCDYSMHKFCAELPERLEGICDVEHTLYFLTKWLYSDWKCGICRRIHKSEIPLYRCPQCLFYVDANCALKELQKIIIYHPSHKHTLACITREILSKCDACGEEHKGIFYHCHMCARSFIHSHCAFLPKKLHIQHITNDIFSHIHPLTLAYSFPLPEQESKFNPRCRVCLGQFSNPNLWIYKCDKCRYYTHLNCATSRNEPFMSILTSPGTGKTIKNYKDVEYPDLLHLPFPDPSYSILKHLFFKKNGPCTLEVPNDVTKTHDNISHQHSLVSSRIKSISFHDPMKRIELLCNGCLRPITTTPIYMCGNEDDHCNFVLHEWCSRLPTELKDHHDHPEHTLFLHSTVLGKFFGVFTCNICYLPCNGFVYYCKKCEYHIDVNCAFLPKEITHASHPNHLLSRNVNAPYYICKICYKYLWDEKLSYSCHICDNFHLHPKCALLIPETTTHKCDRHPMKLSYFPIENHKSEYFCEICEEEFDPELPFYHCHECMQSMHPACAPSILRYETYTSTRYDRAIYKFVNVKFGGTYNNIKVHEHPLSFVQGIESDGECLKCYYKLQFKMIFKCLNCKFAVDIDCCKYLSR